MKTSSDLTPNPAECHSDMQTAVASPPQQKDYRSEQITRELLNHPLVREAFIRLQVELPDDLSYHSFQHTKEVFEKSIQLAIRDGLSERDIMLVAIAAAWHDTGFIQQRTRNEPIGAAWAREAMQRVGGFTESEILDVETAILNTYVAFNPELKTLVQRCTGRISPWLLDADLANFGQTNLLLKSCLVFEEIARKPINSPNDFADEAGRAYIATTLRMLTAHQWKSPAATRELSEQKLVNRALLGQLFVELHGGTEVARQNAWKALNGS